MKFFASILSIYILILTVTPCCDGWISGYVNKVEHIQKTTDTPSNEIDRCSPFCTCSCCTSPILYQAVFFDFNASVFPAGKFIDLKSDFISSIYASIWQPPELS